MFHYMSGRLSGLFDHDIGKWFSFKKSIALFDCHLPRSSHFTKKMGKVVFNSENNTLYQLFLIDAQSYLNTS